jgi:hypothetical protein
MNLVQLKVGFEIKKFNLIVLKYFLTVEKEMPKLRDKTAPIS